MTDAASLEQRELIQLLNRLEIRSERVPDALEFAESVHGEQRRAGGGPYLEEHIYPVTAEVARFLSRVDPADAPNAVLTAILHDTIEDSSTLTERRFVEPFGKTVANWVATLTKPAKRGGKSGEATAEDEARYAAGVADSPLPVRAIKVFDRLNNLAALHQRPPEKRWTYLTETRAHYLDLAHSVDDSLARQMADLIAAQETRLENRAAT